MKNAYQKISLTLAMMLSAVHSTQSFAGGRHPGGKDNWTLPPQNAIPKPQTPHSGSQPTDQCPFINPCETYTALCAGAGAVAPALETVDQFLATGGLKSCLVGVGVGITGNLLEFLERRRVIRTESDFFEFLRLITNLGCTALACIPVSLDPRILAGKAACCAGKQISFVIECEAYRKECENYQKVSRSIEVVPGVLRADHLCPSNVDIKVSCPATGTLTDFQLRDLMSRCNSRLSGRPIDPNRFADCVSNCAKRSCPTHNWFD